MSLVNKQHKFAMMIANLLLIIEQKGYKVTFGDAYRDGRVPYGHPRSLHRKRLAVDLNLFLDGRFLRTTEEYREIGEEWERMGGTWGGRFDDGNHFSLAHEGMK